MSTILVTCVGSGVGQSVVDSLNLTNHHVVIGIDTNKNVYGHHFCDKFFVVPSLYSESYLAYVLNLSIKEKVDLIIPGHDHELLLLSRHIEMFHENGIEVIVSDPDIIEISRDKYEWYSFFSDKGCPIVPTYRLLEFKKNPDRTIFPAIVKPCGGSASQGISIIDGTEALELLKDEDIIQPYLFPLPDDENYKTIRKAVKQHRFIQMSEISIQLIFSHKSEYAGIYISKNTLKNGVPVYVNPIQPEDFEYLDDIMKFVSILLQYKVKGPVNIQGRITEKGLVCFEMNMRFTGITGNRAQLGFNEVDFLVDDFLGRDACLQGYAKNKVGVRQVACTTIPRLPNEMKYQKVISIYGGDGFVGSSFVNTLLKQDLCTEINLICSNLFYEKTKILFNDKRVNIFKDLDPILTSVLCQSDVVVNFVSALANKPLSQIYDAIIFQFRQAQNIIKANVPLVINMSSQSVYNQSEDIMKTENAEININDAYAFQKRISEMFFEESNNVSPLMKVVSLRFSRVVGCHYSGFKPKGFFASMIESLAKGETVKISNPENKINLIDIKDVVNAILHIINHTDWSQLPPVLNVGNENVSIREYCDRVIQVLNWKDKIQQIEYADTKEITVSSMIDSSLFREQFRWNNQYSLEDTIKEIANKILS